MNFQRGSYSTNPSMSWQQNQDEQRLSFEPDIEASEFIKKLWKMDRHRPRAYWDYAIDIEAKRKTMNDIPPPTLFAFVNEDLLLKVTTYRRLMRLLMMYQNNELLNQREDSEVAKDWKNAELKFLSACYSTPLMQKLHQSLAQKNKVVPNSRDFINYLHKLWFTPTYSPYKHNQSRSSLFERVFVGRTKQGSYIDFHYWLQYYLYELEGTVNFNRIKNDGSKYQKSHNLVTVDFSWSTSFAGGSLKSIPHKGSIFIGTSPEFELALYTLCIFKWRSSIYLHVAHSNVVITVVRDGTAPIDVYPTYFNAFRGVPLAAAGGGGSSTEYISSTNISHHVNNGDDSANNYRFGGDQPRVGAPSGHYIRRGSPDWISTSE